MAGEIAERALWLQEHQERGSGPGRQSGGCLSESQALGRAKLDMGLRRNRT